MNLRTQKARGVVALASTHYQNGHKQFGMFGTEAAKNLTVLPYKVPTKFPIFARPCPEVPRHGFVDSREVKTLEELLDVYAEAKNADPRAEVLTMPKLTARASAIATDSGVVWGMGHDGATSGRGDLFNIPCSSKDKAFTDYFIRQYGEGLIKDHAYMELVEHEGHIRLVQFRDGPGLPKGAARNYVPHADYHVTNVITVTDADQENLLAWEKKIAEAPKGTLIHMPGGTLASHLAVHGVAHKHAVWTGAECPDTTQPIQPDSDQPNPLTRSHYKTMAALVHPYSAADMSGSRGGAPDSHGTAAELTPTSDIITSVATLHTMALWDGQEHLLRLRVFGAVAMAKYLAAACIGEARHWRTVGPGAQGGFSILKKPALDWKALGWSDNLWSKPQRSFVFENALRMDLKTLKPHVIACVSDFGGNWGGRGREGNRSVGYGGRNWQRSSELTLDLFQALECFQENPTETRWNAVVLAYNQGVNAAHNGGHLLDKFTYWEDIDKAGLIPQIGFMGSRAMQLCTGVNLEQGMAVEPIERMEIKKNHRGVSLVKLFGVHFPRDVLNLDVNGCEVYSHTKFSPQCHYCVRNNWEKIAEKMKANGDTFSRYDKMGGGYLIIPYIESAGLWEPEPEPVPEPQPAPPTKPIGPREVDSVNVDALYKAIVSVGDSEEPGWTWISGAALPHDLFDSWSTSWLKEHNKWYSNAEARVSYLKYANLIFPGLFAPKWAYELTNTPQMGVSELAAEFVADVKQCVGDYVVACDAWLAGEGTTS